MDIKQKRQRFNALLAAGMMMPAKKDILSGYGVESTKELTEIQLDDVIRRVTAIINQRKVDTDRTTREWRHKCLRMVKECGVDTQDWNGVNAFLMDKRICGKHLYELTIDELMTLHRKLHNVRDNKLAKQHEVKRLTISN